MSYATVLKGEIKSTYLKPNPLVKLNPDERMVQYDPPDVDQAYYDITPVTPVTGKFVEFAVTEKPEAAQLRINNFVAKVDSQVDEIYKLVIGNREPEYRQAELEALAFSSANFSGTAPPTVVAYALAENISNQTAAESILQKAAEWRLVSNEIRAARLSAKAKARAGALSDAASEWVQLLAFLSVSLNITLKGNP